MLHPLASCQIYACLLLVGTCVCQLQTSPPNVANNPIAGQGEPPDGIDANDFPVNTGVLNSAVLGVDETRYTVDLRIIWVLLWEDPRAAEIIAQDYENNGCNFFCNSRPSLQVNSAGLPACCDGIYIPQAEGLNARGYNVQNMPDQHQINLFGNTTVAYSRQFQGTFASSWAYSAFPWDSHFITLEIQTSFLPRLGLPVNGASQGAAFVSTEGYVTADGLTRYSVKQPEAYRPSITSQSIPEWDIVAVGMEVMNISVTYSKQPTDYNIGHKNSGLNDLSVGPANDRGVRVYVQIRRRSTGFWVVVLVLPVALITIFTFASQSYGRDKVKNRIELLTTLFLALVLLQFTLQAVQPASFVLTLPLQLILVSYIYSIALFLVFLFIGALDNQYLRRQRKIMRRVAAKDFIKWETLLTSGQARSDHAHSVLKFRHNAARSVRGLTVTDFDHHASVVVEDGGARQRSASLDAPGKLFRDRNLSFKLESDESWAARQRHSWFYRCHPLRDGVFLWRYLGKMESREYCALVAHRLDTYGRVLLLLSYFIIVISLCWATAVKSKQGALYHVMSQ